MAEEPQFGQGDVSTAAEWSAKLQKSGEAKTCARQYMGTSYESVCIEHGISNGKMLTYDMLYPLSDEGLVGVESAENKDEDATVFADSLYLGMTRKGVRLADKLSQQHIAFNLRGKGRDLLSPWLAKLEDKTFFNHACGYTPANAISANFRGHNTILAPSASRHIHCAGNATDEAVGADTDAFLTPEDIDSMRALAAVEDEDNLVPTIRPMSNGMYVLFVHPSQLREMRMNSFWRDIQVGRLDKSDSSNPLYKWQYGIYGDTMIVENQFVTQGVNSTTGAAVANTRRAVFCGAGALSIGYGGSYAGGSWDWFEEMKDAKMWPRVVVDRIWGMKKNRFNSIDAASIVCTSYSVMPS